MLMMGAFTEFNQKSGCVQTSTGTEKDVTWMGSLTGWQELVLLFGTVLLAVIL